MLVFGFVSSPPKAQLFEDPLLSSLRLEFLGNLKCLFLIDLGHLNLVSVDVRLFLGVLLLHLGLLSIGPPFAPHLDIHNSGLIPL